MRVATLAVWIVLAASSSTVLGQEWPSPFRHLPENTMAVTHVRIDALLKSEWGKPLWTEFLSKKDMKESLEKLTSEQGIDLLAVDAVTIALLDPVLTGEPGQGPRPHYMRATPGLLGPRRPSDPFALPDLRPPANIVPPLPAPSLPPSQAPTNPSIPPPPPPPPLNPPLLPRGTEFPKLLERSEFVGIAVEGGPNIDSLFLLIVHMRKALDRKQVMRKKADLDPSGGGRFGLLFLNDSTFAIGPPLAIAQFAANTSDKESELGKQLAQEPGRPAIQGGYRLTAAMKKAVLADGADDRLVSSMFPLLNLTQATFVLDAGKTPELKFRLQASSEKQANLAAEAVKTMLAATEAYCEKAVAEFEQTAREAQNAQAKREARDAIALTKAAARMVGGARVDQRQAEVSVTLQMDLTVQQLLPLLQDVFTWNAAPRPVLGNRSVQTY